MICTEKKCTDFTPTFDIENKKLFFFAFFNKNHKWIGHKKKTPNSADINANFGLMNLFEKMVNLSFLGQSNDDTSTQNQTFKILHKRSNQFELITGAPKRSHINYCNLKMIKAQKKIIK